MSSETIYPRDSKQYDGPRVVDLKTFIQKAEWVHGKGKWDYSLVVYTAQKYKIRCPRHDYVFEQYRGNHFRGGGGCPYCNDKVIDTETFIWKANRTHGEGMFDYSLSVYGAKRAPITIICTAEGHIFDITPMDHIAGTGCPECRKKNALKPQEDAIADLVAVHGVRYDYSDSVYTGTKNPIKIICKEHGEFHQAYGNHKAGQNCPKCSNRRTRTTEEWVTEASSRYGDLYDYGQSEYVDSYTPIEVWCNTHEITFNVMPRYHVTQKSGCPVCDKTIAVENRLNKKTAHFFARADELGLGERYDYSKVDFSRGSNRIDIRCKLHDHWFTQHASTHLEGNVGCLHCSPTVRLTTEEWVSRAMAKHDGTDKFDFSLVEYVNKDTPVTIICKVHGEFQIRPGTFMSSVAGCQACAGKKRLTTGEFVARASAIHKDEDYDYTHTVYVNSSTRVKVFCNAHQEFFYPIPNNHLRGSKCTHCAKDRRSGYYVVGNLTEEEKVKPAFLYWIRVTNKETGKVFDKIGVTIKTIKKRFALLGGYGFTYEIVDKVGTNLHTALSMEEEIMTQMEGYRWKVHDFRNSPVGGWTECFRLGLVDDVWCDIAEQEGCTV